MFVSPLEARVPGVAYTVDTLEQLRKRIDADQSSLFLIIGGDSLHTLTRWKDYARLPTLAEIIPVERPGASDISHDLELREHLSAALGPDVATRILSNIVPYEGRALSSTELRTRIRAGESSLPMPTCVHHYCVKRGIYV
jgi:nicotinate (nicotinamide) nucleotide adenylyltransferase